MISSPNNPTIRRTRRLRKKAERTKRGAFIVEGHRAVRVALDRQHRVDLVLHAPGSGGRHRQLLVDAADAGAQIIETSRGVLKGLTSSATTPDVLAVARIPDPHRMVPAGPVLILAGVRDPAAVGMLLASAVASGITRAVAVRGTADLFSSTPVRAGAGAHFVLGLAEAASLEDSVAGLGPVVVLGDEGSPPWSVDLSGSPAFVVGDTPISVYDAKVALPAREGGATAPLAVRGAVLMFEAMRQREAG